MLSRRNYVFIGIILPFFLCSCASVNLKAFGREQSVSALEDDEARIWRRSNEAEEALDSGGHLYDDPALVSYINKVLIRLIPEDAQGSGLKFRAKILRDPRMNAFCFADGSVYIHTGIISRMDNESQLATLLGHEVAHAIKRHGIKFFRDLKNKTAIYNTFAVTSAALGGAFGDLANALGAMGTLSSIYGYSKDNEREADYDGFQMMRVRGYDINEAPKLFNYLQDNFDKEKASEPFFFGMHPRLEERINSYNQLIKEVKAMAAPLSEENIESQENFIRLTHELILENSLLDLSLGRFETAKVGIKKYLAQEPRSAKAYYYLGQVYLQQYEQPENKRLADKETKEEKKNKAIEYYDKAIELDPEFALAYRALGLLYFKEKNNEEAKKNFTRYLELVKSGDDSLYIKKYLERL